jgi:hypothetical protein
VGKKRGGFAISAGIVVYRIVFPLGSWLHGGEANIVLLDDGRVERVEVKNLRRERAQRVSAARI